MSYLRPQLGAAGDDGTSTKLDIRDIANSPNVSTVASVALAYHGFKRSGGSVLWALIYAAAGKVFPLEAVPIAMAQGFGTKKSCS